MSLSASLVMPRFRPADPPALVRFFISFLIPSRCCGNFWVVGAESTAQLSPRQRKRDSRRVHPIERSMTAFASALPPLHTRKRQKTREPHLKARVAKSSSRNSDQLAVASIAAAGPRRRQTCNAAATDDAATPNLQRRPLPSRHVCLTPPFITRGPSWQSNCFGPLVISPLDWQSKRKTRPGRSPWCLNWPELRWRLAWIRLLGEECEF